MPHKDPEVRHAYYLAYQRARAEAVNARHRAARAANPDKARAYELAYRRKNPEKIRYHRRRFKSLHPERARHDRQIRRARQAQAARIDLSPEQEAEIIALARGRCLYCPDNCPTCKRRRHKLTIDHIDAVVNKGNHTASNIVAVCGRCNSRKGTRPPPVPVQRLLLTLAPPRTRKAS